MSTRRAVLSVMCGLSVRASDTAVGIPRGHQVRGVEVGGSALTSPRPRDAAVTPRLVRPRPGAMTGLRLALGRPDRRGPPRRYCSPPDSGCSCALSAILPPWLYTGCSFCLEAQPPHLPHGFVPQFLLVFVQILLDMIRGIFQNSNHYLSSLTLFCYNCC